MAIAATRIKDALSIMTPISQLRLPQQQRQTGKRFPFSASNLSSLPGLDQTGTGLPWIDGSKEWNLNLISTEIWLCLLSLGQQIMEGGNEGRRKW